jgi:DnaJ-class molecular chaperone
LPRFFNRRGPTGSFSGSSGTYSRNEKNKKEKGEEQQKSRSKTRTDETFEKSEGKPWNPYEILGVKPGAGPEEIQAAYRRAVQKYHPDKVSHLGEEFQELARKKFIEIQKAYEELKTKR